MVLLSLFTRAAVTLIRPSAQAYREIQQQTRAQNLADALIETIRGEVMHANGYIRFTNGATDEANLNSVFDAPFCMNVHPGRNLYSFFSFSLL